MAIVKHKISKNATYSDVLNYYSYRHKENQKTGHYEPILDEDGLPELRENFAVACLDSSGNEADPYEWDGKCISTNYHFGKNSAKEDVKNHEYIISHPASDREKLTMEALLEEGKAFAREFFQGYDVLMAVHRDTDVDHIHITINSVRAQEREQKEWMKRNSCGEIKRSEYEAGGKHQDSATLRRACNDWLLEYTRAHGLAQKDNNRIADERKQERKAVENRPKLPKKRREILAALLDCLPKCQDINALKTMLFAQYGITLIHRGQTLSFLPQGAQKAVRLRSLGMTPDDFQERLGNPEPPKFDLTRAAEEKQYIAFVWQRRGRNAAKAADTIRKAEIAVSAKIQEENKKYKPQDYRQLRYMIQGITYVERDLQTELDKLNRLLERWQQYLDAAPDWDAHRQYLIWCGVNPEDTTEFRALQITADAISAQMAQAAALRETMVDTAEKWKDTGIAAVPDFSWTPQTEHRLKKQIAFIRANRQKLGRIAVACQDAAKRRLDSPRYLAKADYFLAKWRKAEEQEKALKQKLKQVQRKQLELER